MAGEVCATWERLGCASCLCAPCFGDRCKVLVVSKTPRGENVCRRVACSGEQGGSQTKADTAVECAGRTYCRGA